MKVSMSYLGQVEVGGLQEHAEQGEQIDGPGKLLCCWVPLPDAAHADEDYEGENEENAVTGEVNHVGRKVDVVFAFVEDDVGKCIRTRTNGDAAAAAAAP